MYYVYTMASHYFSRDAIDLCHSVSEYRDSVPGNLYNTPLFIRVVRTCAKPRTKTPQNSPFIGCSETSDLISYSPLNEFRQKPYNRPLQSNYPVLPLLK
jgi:hypothetical protein